MCLVIYPERPTISWEKFVAQVNERRSTLMKKHGFIVYNNTNWKRFKEWYWKTFPYRTHYY